ncbi:hypothetical protein Ddc_08646 [Ditylenchus destructor]|nr:hypothetical protein Ddc_08646 [Ditylenchus destructor]
MWIRIVLLALTCAQHLEVVFSWHYWKVVCRGGQRDYLPRAAHSSPRLRHYKRCLRDKLQLSLPERKRGRDRKANANHHHKKWETERLSLKGEPLGVPHTKVDLRWVFGGEKQGHERVRIGEGHTEPTERVNQFTAR